MGRPWFLNQKPLELRGPLIFKSAVLEILNSEGGAWDALDFKSKP